MTKITRQNFIKNLVLITGLTRSGKTLLAPIVSSMARVEHVAINYLMEQVPMMQVLRSIPDDAAKCLMRYAVDAMVYDLTIGRNMNLRFGDLSSVWRSSRPVHYLKRLFAKEGDAALMAMESSGRLYLLMVHDALWHADIYFSSFPQMRMIHITRHPVDMVLNWYGKGYGGDYFDNPRNATLTIEWGAKTLPYYAAGWEQDYLNMSEIDRIIHMIKKLEDSHYQKYDALSPSQRQQIKIISFERLAAHTDAVIKEIADFLGTSPTRQTARVCKKENCPRIVHPQARDKKLEEIQRMASHDAFALLQSMAKEYDGRYSMQEAIYEGRQVVGQV
ncbi:MAG TPA: sulfotransferase domain-containing protein [Candidatus Omnitrophota bacterium]|nr:sulfotransferase domain-containing protein [Candidatus Omnitrophota bacterium]